MTQKIDKIEQSFPYFFPAFPRGKRSKRRFKNRNLITIQNKKLDTNVFECYLEHLWKKFSEDKRTSFTYLDCLWFDLYRKRATKAKVLTWIKSKDIFSKNYVFVPIVCWRHWSLLILVHFGERFQSKTTRTPCMLLLDSLGMANSTLIEPEIRKFVSDLYGEENSQETKSSIAKIPLLVPKVPQQKNSEDCGIFVLYYIHLFLKSAPENFNVIEGYPYFMNENWFSYEGFDIFYEKFRTFCRKTRLPEKQTGRYDLNSCNSESHILLVE
ncbi:hypothetical protein GIB67_018797 [Kingdonia uniflora]|uniref:Ubiquitin-like protease family profile domain-containing protein n=1 Tax=Kingdonia uniflora TaxID=39325 RepID=A0A7J7NE56_9MAGN|nr:hypothetical protein GIB67_018797 [Kingdonia uniflora]